MCGYTALVCPTDSAATVFATLMALYNVSVQLSILAGGALAGYLLKHNFSKFRALEILILVGACVTLCILMLTPLFLRGEAMTREKQNKAGGDGQVCLSEAKQSSLSPCYIPV